MLIASFLSLSLVFSGLCEGRFLYEKSGREMAACAPCYESIAQVIEAATDVAARSSCFILTHAPSVFQADTEKLVTMFAQFPSHVTTLRLGWNYLGALKVERLSVIFASMPRSVLRVELEYNWWQANMACCEGIPLASFAEHIQEVVLASNMLDHLPPAILIQSLSGLSSYLVVLDLSKNALGTITGDSLLRALKKLPNKLKELNLSGNQLYNCHWQLASLLGVLPRGIQRLDLSVNQLGRLEDNAWILGLQHHEWLERLDLGSNQFERQVDSHIIQLVRALRVRQVILHDNGLGKRTIASLREIFKWLSGDVNTLDLSDNGFDLNPDEFAELLCCLPTTLSCFVCCHVQFNSSPSFNPSELVWSASLSHIRIEYSQLGSMSFALIDDLYRPLCFLPLVVLNLTGNQLGTSNDIQPVIDAMRSLPRTLKKLTLRDNKLGLLSLESLTSLFRSISSTTVVFFDIRRNDFLENHIAAFRYLTRICKLALDWAVFLFLVKRPVSVWPPMLQTLNLSDNALGSYCDDERRQGLSNIPPQVQNLKLVRNQLRLCSLDDMISLLAALPRHVQRIDLRYNDLFVNRRRPVIDCFFSQLPGGRAGRGRYDLTGNGDSDVGRALLPLYSLWRYYGVPRDMQGLILLFLLNPKPDAKTDRLVEGALTSCEAIILRR